ncbi:MAG: hypothetical protein ACKVQU_07895 [Burkholderiales bacterium]
MASRSVTSAGQGSGHIDAAGCLALRVVRRGLRQFKAPALVAAFADDMEVFEVLIVHDFIEAAAHANAGELFESGFVVKGGCEEFGIGRA